MSMGPDHKIASNAEFTTNVVIFDVAPKPLAGADAFRTVVQETLLPTIGVGGVIQSSGIVYTDMGSHKTQQTLAINLDYLTSAKVDVLYTIWWNNSIVYYTPDNKATIYTLQWADKGLVVAYPVGIKEWCIVKLSFHVLDVT